MEKVAKNIVEISIAGKNVTADISGYLSKITYTDKIEAESDDLTITVEDTSALWQNSWYPQQGDFLSVKLGTISDMLECGDFEIDEIEFDFPPDTMNIKAIGAAISKSLRTKNSKAFEKQSLRKIAQYFADKHKLKLIGKPSDLQKIEIDRKTQDNQTDISFLSSLAREYGLIFSVRGDQLIFIDQDMLESQPAVMTIEKSELTKGTFQDKTSQVFATAEVAVRYTKTNTVTKWSVKPSNKPGEKDTLIVGGNAETTVQAQAKAKGALKNKNKNKVTGTFGLPGRVGLVAGINIELTGIGQFSGKWQVVTSTHTVDKNGGYLTDVSVRKIIS